MAYALSTSTTTRAITQTGTDASQSSAMTTLIASVAAAARSTAYTLGAYRRADTDTSATVAFWYQCTAAGTTGAAAPTWPTTVSGTVVDGTVTWVAVNRPSVTTVGGASQNRKFVDFKGFQFAVQGTATVDDRLEEVFVGDTTGPVLPVDITGSGNLRLGLPQTQISSLDWYTRQTALSVVGNAAAGGNYSIIQVSGASARLELRGASIALCNTSATYGAIRTASSGTFYCREGVLTATDFAKDIRIRAESPSTVDIIGIRCIGVWINQAEAWTNASGIVIENESGPEFNLSSTTPPANGFITWTDYDARKTTAGFYTQKNLVLHTSPYVKMINPYLGSNMDFNGATNAASKQGVVEVIRQIAVSVSTAAGAAITDAAFFCRDVNNSDRVNATPKSYSSPIDYVSDRTYFAVPNGSGVIPTQDILTAVGRATGVAAGSWSRRTKGGTAYSGDLMDFHVWSYAYSYSALPNVPCAGFIGPVSYALKLVADSTVTDTLANVAAYTACETLDKLRDRCKWMKTQQATMEQPTIATEFCTASGSALNFGSINLVIDPLAASPLSYSAGTLTIDAATLAEGTKYKTLATTGTITFLNGGAISCLSTSAAGSTGRLTLTGLPTGCDVVILNAGTSTILNSVDQEPGTSYSWTFTGAQTVDVGVIKPGYLPYYIRNLSLSVLATTSLPVALTADRNYQP